MKNIILRRAIFISLLGHLSAFGFFGFSFGKPPASAGYLPVLFWGQILGPVQLKTGIYTRQYSRSFISRIDNVFLVKAKPAENPPAASSYYLKPQLSAAVNAEKAGFLNKAYAGAFPGRKESTIILHPPLPYGFTLYFTDRQTAHVELAFKIVPYGIRNSILLKRKVSSGNLEVDLLSLRYIGHYLFIRQAYFNPGCWQTVKIDLSAKND